MDIEALKIIQEEECEAFKVFKQDYSSSEASSSESESEGISDIDCVDSYLSNDSSINIVPDTPPKSNRKFVIRSSYKKRNVNLLTENIVNTCTKESPLKTHASSTCSESDSVVLAPSTPEEPASNYTHALHHQSNLSELDRCETASINTEHDQHIENDSQSVNEHVFEIQLNTENPDEILSSPNVPVADLPEIPIPIEMSNTDNPDIYELKNLVAQEFTQLSESDNENDEIPPDYFQIKEEQPPQLRNSSTFELNYFDNNLITYPITQYPRGQILASDEGMGWKV